MQLIWLILYFSVIWLHVVRFAGNSGDMNLSDVSRRVESLSAADVSAGAATEMALGHAAFAWLWNYDQPH